MADRSEPRHTCIKRMIMEGEARVAIRQSASVGGGQRTTLTSVFSMPLARTNL